MRCHLTWLLWHLTLDTLSFTPTRSDLLISVFQQPLIYTENFNVRIIIHIWGSFLMNLTPIGWDQFENNWTSNSSVKMFPNILLQYVYESLPSSTKLFQENFGRSRKTAATRSMKRNLIDVVSDNVPYFHESVSVFPEVWPEMIPVSIYECATQPVAPLVIYTFCHLPPPHFDIRPC